MMKRWIHPLSIRLSERVTCVHNDINHLLYMAEDVCDPPELKEFHHL